MFGRGKRQQPGKIRLPKQSVFPDLNMLKGLFEQAQVNRGQDVELSWAIPGSMSTYSINIKFDQVTPSPQWQIWQDDGRQAKLVSKFETNDLNLILDVVMMLETQTGGAPSPQNAGSQTVKQSGAFAQHNPGQPISQGQNTGNYQGYQQGQTTGGYQTYQQGQSTGTHAPFSGNSSGQDSQFSGGLKSTGQHTQFPGGQTLNPSPDNFRGSPITTGTAPSKKFGDNSGGKSSFGSALPEGSLPPDFYSDAPAAPGSRTVGAATPLEGNLDGTKTADLLTSFGVNKLTGLLELASDTLIGQIYFMDGTPKHAQAGASRGDEAIKEIVTWRTGTYSFKPNKQTDMVSCERSLQASIMEGTALLEQLRHLEEAGLVYESMLVIKQKNLGDTELKLLLSKGHPLDFEWQKSMYELLKRKRTFTDLLRDRPMEMSQWAPLLFNFLYCGIMEVKPPAQARGGALDFLGEDKQVVQALKYHFLRPETGIFSYEGLLYFLEYEYYRFDAYGWPLSFILFEAGKRKGEGSIGKEMLSPDVITTAARRIELVKRPLDLLGHCQGMEFGLILPNTKTSQAAFVANRILDALSNTPLAPSVDRRNLVLSFGVAGLPTDGDDLPALLESARAAKNEAKEGTFPIVLSRTLKRD